MASEFLEFKVGARTAPLGLRFWDPVTARVVGDGLRVAAYPVADPSRRTEAIANPSKAYVFHKLPGMTEVERGEGDDAFWTSPPATREYVVEVEDMGLGAPLRFLPFRLKLSAPVRGVFPWTAPAGATFPGMPPSMVPLFSAATRAVPSGLGVIRAQLWDPNAPTPPGMTGPGGPAAWAVLSAKVGDTDGARGVTDAQGNAVLIFAYPSPMGAGVDGLTAVPLTKQKWPVELQVRYAAPVGKVPELATLPELLEQPTATLWEKWDDTAPANRVKLASTTLTLAYGQELPVRTAGAKPGPVLYVTG